MPSAESRRPHFACGTLCVTECKNRMRAIEKLLLFRTVPLFVQSENFQFYAESGAVWSNIRCIAYLFELYDFTYRNCAATKFHLQYDFISTAHKTQYCTEPNCTVTTDQAENKGGIRCARSTVLAVEHSR